MLLKFPNETLVADMAAGVLVFGVRRNAMYVVHSSQKEIKCVFYTVIVRNKAIMKKYFGGVRAFTENHKASCNVDISSTFHMGDGVNVVCADLEINGFDHGIDFVVFDSAGFALGITECGRKVAEPQSVDMGVPWLRGRYSGGYVYVWYDLGEDSSIDEAPQTNCH